MIYVLTILGFLLSIYLLIGVVGWLYLNPRDPSLVLLGPIPLLIWSAMGWPRRER